MARDLEACMARLAEQAREIGRLTESLELSRVLLRERDARLEKLEALAKLHFGHASYELLRQRDERIDRSQRELDSERGRAAEERAAAERAASELWRQTERIEALETELTVLRRQFGRESA